ncbi:MAG: peptidoglycan D,D-transpeptidase FtsI family protein [Gammaproteobacteria bacterium]
MYAIDQNDATAAAFAARRKVLLAFMSIAAAFLIGRAFDLQVMRKQFLKQQGDMRHVAEITVSAYRGMILDRNGEPLAISTPMETVWANPSELENADKSDIEKMEKLLGLPRGKVSSLIVPGSNRHFAYVARRVNPQLAADVKALKLSGVYFKREFKRFYPAGPVSAHLVGFTDIDDTGQEGIERAYEDVLKGIDGRKRVIRDGTRRIIDDIEAVSAPIDGRDIRLSIDQRIQYLAFRELQTGFLTHRAHSASLIVLDAKTGDVLADVNQPTYNPNNRGELKGRLYRNRALTDVYEPGSTVKPFVVAAALDGGFVSPSIEIETHGFYRVGRNTVRDVHNYGTLNLTQVLKKSSNVAASKIALAMPREYFWRVYDRLGFGRSAGVGFPGEANGSLLDYRRWNDFAQATISFGYGVNASLLQLARAYTALADDGMLHSVSLIRRENDDGARRVFSARTARSVRAMLETVVMKDGTAFQANVRGYRVAGKTGTVKKLSATGGYADKSYLSVFVGMAPAQNPRAVIAVLVDEPTAGDYYGGLVAAPIFSKVMAGTLRILGVAPDQEEAMPVLLANRDES